MAVEDIPPRPQRGLGERLGDILARQAEGVYESYSETLFGGEGTASEEDVESAKSSIIEETILPYPDYIREILQSNKSPRAVKRPDLYDEFYGQASDRRSTRVWAMQWIPVAKHGELVLGDLVVAFARTTGVNGGSLFIYTDILEARWSSIKESDSFGKSIGRLSHHHVISDHDKLRYQTLHKKTFEGEPWEDWIWDKEGVWASGRPNNESATYSPERAAIRKTSKAIRATKRRSK